MARTEELNRYYKHVGKRPDLFKKQGALELVLDEEEIAEFEDNGGRKIGVRYQSPYHMMVVDLVKDQNSNKFAYERVIQTVDAPSGKHKAGRDNRAEEQNAPR